MQGESMIDEQVNITIFQKDTEISKLQQTIIDMEEQITVVQKQATEEKSMNLISPLFTFRALLLGEVEGKVQAITQQIHEQYQQKVEQALEEKTKEASEELLVKHKQEAVPFLGNP